MQALINLSLICALAWLISGCSAVKDWCPFDHDESESISIVIYPEPAVVDLDYRDIPGSQNTVIVKGAYQHALSVAGIANAPQAVRVEASVQQLCSAKQAPGSVPLRETVYFDFDRSTLSSNEKNRLDSFMDGMDLASIALIRIEGHTDSKGSSAHNSTLSVKRAESVRDYLINTIGLAGEKLSVEGFGEYAPSESNRSEPLRTKNRRADLIPTLRY
jgi:outer membrane protein OmpA-like peptidoglycan-associated protein